MKQCQRQRFTWPGALQLLSVTVHTRGAHGFIYIRKSVTSLLRELDNFSQQVLKNFGIYVYDRYFG